MGEWHEVKTVLYDGSPCQGCTCGWFNIGQKTINGRLYEKHDDCHEDCERFKKYLEGKLNERT